MKKLCICLFVLAGQIGMAQTQNSAHFEDALKLMKLSNATVENALVPIYTQISTEKLDDFKNEIQPALEKMYTSLAEVAVEQYSHKDIKGMLAFYETDLGKTMLEGQSEILEASMQVGQQFSMDLMPILQKYMDTGY